MKIKVCLIVALLLSVPVWAQESSIQNIDEHIRLEYHGANTPDSMVFRLMLWRIDDKAKQRSKQEIEDWIFTEMNIFFDAERETWILNEATNRHSREEIKDIIPILLTVAKESASTRLETRRELLCPEAGFANHEAMFRALERKNSLTRAGEESIMRYTYDAIGEKLSQSLREWINRSKSGYSNKKYNTRSLWAGNEAGLKAKLEGFCAATQDGVKQ